MKIAMLILTILIYGMLCVALYLKDHKACQKKDYLDDLPKGL